MMRMGRGQLNAEGATISILTTAGVSVTGGTALSAGIVVMVGSAACVPVGLGTSEYAHRFSCVAVGVGPKM